MRCPEAALALLLALAAGAGAGAADEADRARISLIAPSERLRLLAFGRLLETGRAPPEAVDRLKQTMIRQGFYHLPGQAPLVASEAWISPVLSHDGNINGGVLRDSFTQGGFVFTADPSVRSKSGIVMGVAAGALTRLAWGEGRFFEVVAAADFVWSPEHDIGRSSAQGRLCARNHMAGWTFLDFCHAASLLDRDLDRAIGRETGVTLSTLFDGVGGLLEAGLEVSHIDQSAGGQEAVTASFGSVWDDLATTLSVTLSTPIPGETVQRSRIAGEVHWLAGDRRWSLGLWRQEARGGTFLGDAREDRTLGLTLAHDLRPGITVQAGLMRNQSTVAFFDYDQISLELSFDALHW